MPQAVTANRLSDGEVVYLAPDGRWSERLDDCRTAAGTADSEAMMEAGVRAEQARVVIGAYLFEVECAPPPEGGAGGVTLRPAQLREVIRARGPTVRRDLGKQALRVSGDDVPV